MKKKKSFEIDMVRGPVMEKMLRFSLPLMCSSILQLLFNAADIIVVGRFAGDNSLAAVGSNSSLIALMCNLFIGLSIGANVIVARYYGARRVKDLKDTVHTAVLMGIVSGVVMSIVGIAVSRQVLIWMKTPDQVLELATVYLRIYFLCMPGMMVYNFGSAVLRAVGDTKRPLLYLAVPGAINVVLNLFFVIVLKMDVAGVATATAISQTMSGLLILRCLSREESDIKLVFSDLRIKKDKLAQILKIGLPSGVQGVIFSLTNVMIQASVNSFGATVIAGSSASGNIENFIYFGMNAFYQATISFTSQNLGAKKVKRLDRILRSGLICVVIAGAILGGSALIFGRQLLGIYSASPDVIDAGMERLSIIALSYIICGVMDVMVGSLRGMGYSVIPMLVSLIGVCGLRMLWVFTLFRIPEFHTITMLFATYPVTWVVTVSAHIITFFIVRKKLRMQALNRTL